MKNKGFTLIELLVVIAIIGVLSSVLILVIKPSDQINKAKAAKIAKDLKLIEKAFQLTAADDMENYNLYPTESELGLGNNPKIITLVENGALRYVSKNIKPNLGTHIYRYDNDNDIYPYLNNCPGGNNYGGVNVFIYHGFLDYPEILTELDRMIDNSDGLRCGKIKRVDNDISFTLDDNQ